MLPKEAPCFQFMVQRGAKHLLHWPFVFQFTYDELANAGPALCKTMGNRRGNKLLHRYKGQQGGQTKINQHQKHQQQQQQFITLPITKYVEILFVFVRTHLCLRRQPSTNTIAKPPLLVTKASSITSIEVGFYL